MSKTRRLISVGILIVMMALFIAPFSNGEKESMKDRTSFYAQYEGMEPLTIYLATDTHYIAPSLHEGSAYFDDMVLKGDGKFMPYGKEINEAFIEKVIEDRPAALIVAGDLTFNGARESHEEYAAMLKRVEDAGIPVLAIPGNHDFTVKRAARFLEDSYELVSSIDANEYLQLYSEFGREDSFDFDETSLSYIYEVAPNLRILCVDVNTIAGMSGLLTEGTLSFVEQQLKKAQDDKAYVIGVTHQTLLTHSELTSQGMSFINSDRLLELYEKYGVVMNLSGHMHIQHIAVSDGGVPDIATGSLMTSPNYYARIDIEGKKFSYNAIPFEVPSIPDFAAKAHDFLWDNAYRQGKENLKEGDSDDMAEFFADFNVAYIAGRSDQIPWNDEVIKKWKKSDSFVPRYFEIVKEEGANNFTTFEVDLGDE
ncbi:MAG: metallophosphoesterase [Butyrivibrio sp.]|nr:metallophosphoesterase [Butyrivibrio sp.]